MFKRITQCPHFPQRIKHVAFIIAIFMIAVGAGKTRFWSDYPHYDEFFMWLVIPFLIFFFLWKTNYFTRNKN